MQEYYQSHPSIIDSLFTGTLKTLTFVRHTTNHSDLWQMQELVSNIQSLHDSESKFRVKTGEGSTDIS